MSLAGLRALIDNHTGMEVVGQREHPQDAMPQVAPDVAVIDHWENDNDGVAPLIAMGRSAGHDTPCIVLTGSTDSELLSTVFRRGARGLVFKHQAPPVLIEAIQRVHEGDVYLDRAATTQLITALLRPPRETPAPQTPPTLNPRDHRIVTLVSHGLSNSEVASALCVSEATIRNRLTTIFQKVGATNRLQLVVQAHQTGLVTLPLEGAETATKSSLRLV